MISCKKGEKVDDVFVRNLGELFTVSDIHLTACYQYGYEDGVKEIIKNLFVLDMITIEKIAEIAHLSILEIEQLLSKE